MQGAAGTGHWSKAGRGLVPLRGLFVRDRDAYFFTTDLAGTPAEVIGSYTGRWNRATTFEEGRAHLGLETTRGWCQRTVRRAASCLFGLYPVVALLFPALPEAKRAGAVAWPGKEGTTFADALRAVRRWRWAEWVFPSAGAHTVVQKLPEPLHEIILSALAPAA